LGDLDGNRRALASERGKEKSIKAIQWFTGFVGIQN